VKFVILVVERRSIRRTAVVAYRQRGDFVIVRSSEREQVRRRSCGASRGRATASRWEWRTTGWLARTLGACALLEMDGNARPCPCQVVAMAARCVAVRQTPWSESQPESFERNLPLGTYILYVRFFFCLHN